MTFFTPKFCMKYTIFSSDMLPSFLIVSLQAVRQEHIRGLIKGNAVAKAELKCLHAEVRISASIIGSLKLTLYGTQMHDNILDIYPSVVF